MSKRLPGAGEDAPLISAQMIAAAVDPSLPPGVIGIKDSDGLTWRYPLTEFTEDPGVNPEFAAFKEEMAEMVMDTCEVPEDQRQMWRDLR